MSVEPTGLFSDENSHDLIYIPTVKPTLYCFAFVSLVLLWGCTNQQSAYTGNRPTEDRDQLVADDRSPNGYGEKVVEVTPTPRPSVTPGMIDKPVDPTGRPISTPGSH
jgi:hypothetical protein